MYAYFPLHIIRMHTAQQQPTHKFKIFIVYILFSLSFLFVSIFIESLISIIMMIVHHSNPSRQFGVHQLNWMHLWWSGMCKRLLDAHFVRAKHCNVCRVSAKVKWRRTQKLWVTAKCMGALHAPAYVAVCFTVYSAHQNNGSFLYGLRIRFVIALLCVDAPGISTQSFTILHIISMEGEKGEEKKQNNIQ